MADQQSDHDLLIAISTQMGILTRQVSDFMAVYESRHQALVGRVTALETKDRGDSEKTRAISVDVQRSLANHEKIGSLETKLNIISDDVQELRRKSNLLDTINAIGVMISGVIGYYFGNR